VLVARALCQNAEILVLDEPTAHLDFRHELNVMEIIARLVREQGISIVMATHFLNQAFFLEAEGVPTRVALMEQGSFGAIGTPSEVLTEEQLSSVFHIAAEVTTDSSGERKAIIPLRNLEL
jgi:iron complex transport system ATP-binding protein